MVKILFICKYNVYRSRVAEGYFKKINKNKKIKTISRGLIMGGKPDKIQIKLAKKLLGVNVVGKPIPVNLEDLKKADKIIVVANDVPEIMFDYQLFNFKNKLEIWKVKDEQKQNSKNIKNLLNNIKKKVERLVEELK